MKQGDGNPPFHGGGEDLIGVEKQHPGGGWGVVAEVPVALLGEAAVPVELENSSAVAVSCFSGSISAAGINDDHRSSKILANSL